jgi:hypothetical protein
MCTGTGNWIIPTSFYAKRTWDLLQLFEATTQLIIIYEYAIHQCNHNLTYFSAVTGAIIRNSFVILKLKWILYSAVFP